MFRAGFYVLPLCFAWTLAAFRRPAAGKAGQGTSQRRGFALFWESRDHFDEIAAVELRQRQALMACSWPLTRGSSESEAWR
eukprot:Skav203372  [mRNA]  locus=scaffold940:384444:390738:- [translate_table: standard]